ncbi:hypothetical protein CBR_g12407 [Chara braunii]|uniref:Uncharacterized protein n=1 Tax=Chara braunii TaxID=69332 RepID=A0A388JSB7_CHABU|nr:hypothetical protein CBR_g12407 [Chara braunii]|eukprot:GBG60670.1 hypothetical protein CBR_g12407 [Chara braunii]
MCAWPKAPVHQSKAGGGGGVVPQSGFVGVTDKGAVVVAAVAVAVGSPGHGAFEVGVGPPAGGGEGGVAALVPHVGVAVARVAPPPAGGGEAGVAALVPRAGAAVAVAAIAVEPLARVGAGGGAAPPFALALHVAV